MMNLSNKSQNAVEIPQYSPRTSNYFYILFNIAVGVLTLWLALNVFPDGSKYSPDSANYIEQSRSVLAGNGFESRPDDLNDIGGLQTPDKLFPPGYPLVIVAVSSVFSAPMEVVALWISRISLMVLPLIVFVAFSSSIGDFGATCMGILVGFSPGVITWGQYALTDVFSLTLVVASFGFTLAAWSPQQVCRTQLLAFAGGLVAGIAYLTRNAHLALLLSMPITFSILLMFSPPEDKVRTSRVGLLWMIGATVVVLPWLIRNVVVFGMIQPYEMPPSTINAWWNLRTFIGAQFSEVVGSTHHIGNLVGWSVPGLAALLILTVAVARLIFMSWPLLQNCEKRTLIASLIYSLIGTSIVIAARSKYQWGEEISDRHTLQYALFFMLPISILIRHVLGSTVARIALALAIMVPLTTLRYFSLAHEENRARGAVSNTTSIIKRIMESRSDATGPCSRDHKSLVVSNYAYLYRILCDASSLDPENSGMLGKPIGEIIASIETRVKHRPFIIALYSGRGLESSKLPLPNRDLEALTSQGWIVRENSKSALVLARN